MSDGGTSKRKTAGKPPGRPAGKLPGRAGARREGVGAGPSARRRDAAPGRAAAAAGFASGPRVGVLEAVAPTVQGLGYELVEVERAARGLLRVTIDRVPGRVYRHADGSVDGGEAITVDDCEQVTRQLQYALEVEGLDYARLEVSSPGLDRALRTEADWHRFAGSRIALTLREPFKGRKNWQGLLVASMDPPAPAGATAVAAAVAEAPAAAHWSLHLDDGPAGERVLGFTLAEVREARLVPVIDFKGRKSGRAAAAADAAPDVAPGMDGGKGIR